MVSTSLLCMELHSLVMWSCLEAHLMVPDAWLSDSTRLPSDSTSSPAIHSAL